MLVSVQRHPDEICRFQAVDTTPEVNSWPKPLKIDIFTSLRHSQYACLCSAAPAQLGAQMAKGAFAPPIRTAALVNRPQTGGG